VTNIQSNVYSSRGIFWTICQDLPFRSFSLYRRPASDTPLSKKFRISVITDYSPRVKYGRCTVNRIMRLRDLAIWRFSRWPAAILDLVQLEWRCSICRPRKPHIEANMKGIGWSVAELWPFEIFAKCVNRPWGRSLVGGRSSVVNIHTSYADLI